MGNQGEDNMPISIYKTSNFTGGCLEIRLFYVRITPCVVDNVPDHLTLCHLRREMGVLLETNGYRVPATDNAEITLRRDRIDKESSEVTYVSTDRVRVSGPVEFEVHENELILCGSLERVEMTWTDENSDLMRSGWSMDCYTAATFATNGKFGVSSSSIEVYIAGCCSGVPVILTKTIQVSPRRKLTRQGMLDAIPEEEEVAKEHGRQIKPRTTEDMSDDEIEEKAGYGFYSDEMYPGEDGQLSWFNAGVRVGVGIGLGMCVGVGLGVGLLMSSYQATTRNLRRRFF